MPHIVAYVFTYDVSCSRGAKVLNLSLLEGYFQEFVSLGSNWIVIPSVKLVSGSEVEV